MSHPLSFVGRALILSSLLGASIALAAPTAAPKNDLVLDKRTYANPILPGFNPDPSICRVGDDFYLATSSFEYFPGVPIYHSRDLVNWKLIGHALNRPSQLNLDDSESSAGLYAPALRYHNGTFYMVTTLVHVSHGGNFIVTAKDPAGPWSEPHWMRETPGIDPSLFFDDDGKIYMTGNERPKNPAWPGQRDIWIQELDVNEWKLLGEKKNLLIGSDYYQKGSPMQGDDVANLFVIEAAHVYKKNGRYYVMVAHGGTGHNHAASILSSPTLFGPYEENPHNPILTHRDLSKTFPITATGHADLVSDPKGNWWMVHLGKRPYEGENFVLGRETFLVPVDWSGKWPVVNPDRTPGRSELVLMKPDLPPSPSDAGRHRDEFGSSTLHPQWTFIRTPRSTWWSLTDRKDFLRIALRPVAMTEKANPSFVGLRIEDMEFSATTKMEFTPTTDLEEAGIVVERDRNYFVKFTRSRHQGKDVLTVALKNGPKSAVETLATHEIGSGPLMLKVHGKGLVYRFSYSTNGTDWVAVETSVDCSKNGFVAGGQYTGTFVGMYASSNGQPTTNHADFDWFHYRKSHELGAR